MRVGDLATVTRLRRRSTASLKPRWSVSGSGFGQAQRYGSNRVETPFPRDALHPVNTFVLEGEARSRNQVFDGLRDQHLRPIGQSRDSGAEHNCYSARLAGDGLNFASVDAGANFDSERPHRCNGCRGTAHRSCGPIEGGEEPVSCRVDLPASVPSQERPHRGVVLLDKIPPRGISKCRGLLGRADDVREEDGCEHSLEVGFLSPDTAEKPFYLAEYSFLMRCPGK